MVKPEHFRDPMARIFGRNVRMYRGERSLYKIAKGARMSKIHVSRIEQGLICPGIGTAVRLAKSLGCSLQDLVENPLDGR